LEKCRALASEGFLSFLGDLILGCLKEGKKFVCKRMEEVLLLPTELWLYILSMYALFVSGVVSDFLLPVTPHTNFSFINSFCTASHYHCLCFDVSPFA
jgi:hypothetical protein